VLYTDLEKKLLYETFRLLGLRWVNEIDYLIKKEQFGGSDKYYNMYLDAKIKYLQRKQQIGGDPYYSKYIDEKIKHLENKKRHSSNSYLNYGPQVSSDMEDYRKSSNLLASMVQFSDDSE